MFRIIVNKVLNKNFVINLWLKFDSFIYALNLSPM